MPTTAQPRLLTLPDIASLAGVQRPVVSMWRRRTSVRGLRMPFPTAVQTVGGIEHFASDDVTTYLAVTGRGNNTETALDAPILAAPVDADHTSAELLLALALLADQDLAGADLPALAATVDPDDALLLREIRTGIWSTDLPGHIDGLVAASLGSGDALERLDGGRLARRAGDRGCTPELVALIVQLAAVAGEHAGTASLLEPSGDPLLDRTLAPHFAGLITADRRLRRRAAVLGWSVVPPDATTAVVRVRSLLGRPTDDVLTALDDVVLELGRGDVAVVLGPAAALTDRLVGRAEKDRAGTLRPGSLAAALRLPRGQWRAAHRQSLAVWVLTGGPARSVVRLADLDGVLLDLDDLAADVNQALAPMGSGTTEARAYRYLRPRELAPVLAGGPLVPRGTRAITLNTSGDLVDRAHAAGQVLAEPIPEFVAAVTTGRGRLVVRSLSLGELAADKRLVLRQGRRIDPAETDPQGTVRVLSADGALDDVRLDPFDARTRRANWTEPGDVVFIEKPQPRAVVDTQGSGVVATPSRILRLTDNAPVGPYALAERINRAPAGTEWRTWEVPSLPRAEAAALDARLAEVARYRHELHRRLRALDTWGDTVITGIAAGSLAVTPSDHATAENR